MHSIPSSPATEGCVGIPVVDRETAGGAESTTNKPPASRVNVDDDGPYGQNTAAALHDQRVYDALDRPVVAVPMQPSSVDAYDVNGGDDDVAQGRIVGHHSIRVGQLARIARAADTRWLMPPPGLYVSPEYDMYVIVPFGKVNLAWIIVQVGVIIIASVMVSRNGPDFPTVALLVLAGAFLVAALFFTRTSRLVFDHDRDEARIEERRLIQFCCEPSVSFAAPYDALQDVVFEGVARPEAGPAELYIAVMGDHRIPLGGRQYETETQMLGDVMPWRAYIARLRGLDLEDMAIAITLLRAAGEALTRASHADDDDE